MATSIDTLTKKYKKQYATQEAEDIAAVEDVYNKNVAAIDENFNTEVSNTEREYNTLYNQNSVDRIINERKIAENMANLGSSDSGLNRTQQTANQLSYANTNSRIGVAKQQAIDTLALAMRNKKTELEIQKNTDIQGIKSGYANQAVSLANEERNAEIKSAADIEVANIKAEQDRATRRGKMYDDYYDDVFTMLRDTDEYGNSKYSDQEKADMFVHWVDKYGDVLTESDIQTFLNKLPENVRKIVEDEYGITNDFWKHIDLK